MISSLKGVKGAADRSALGHRRPLPSLSQRTFCLDRDRTVSWSQVKPFGELPARFGYPGNGTHGVPRRARALSSNNSLRITAIKADISVGCGQ